MSRKTPLERFEEKYIVQENGCWRWIASTDSSGYGTFKINGKVWGAHRASYVLYGRGDLRHPGEQFVFKHDVLMCHTCDNRLCVNPDHLFEGSPKDNWHDCRSKGRDVHVAIYGEANKNSRLSNEDVSQIRRLHSTGSWTNKDLANKFGINKCYVSGIVNKRKRIYG